MPLLEELKILSWEQQIAKPVAQKATQSLEKGRILFMPSLSFALLPEEMSFLSADKVDPKRKNISYDLKKDQIGGSLWKGREQQHLKQMLNRYATLSSDLLRKLFPHYTPQLSITRTSFRPTEIRGRKSSVHKDDTRLHVDAFPSSPTQGWRIGRMFTNINPHGEPRVWRVGEPFEKVVKKFAGKVPMQLPGSATFLHFLKMTKAKRSAYDHYMLHIHNQMKEDMQYQISVSQEEIHFPAGSSWIVFTDQVSHAAMAGQHVLEQTFSLPAEQLNTIATAPVKVLEKHLRRTLI